MDIYIFRPSTIEDPSLGMSNSGFANEPMRYFFHKDQVGSSSFITDGIGQPIQFIGYTPFGESFINVSATHFQTPYRFNGKEQDAETGLYNYGARYYDPKISRWISVDPLADQFAGYSPYNYTLNNPILMIDPTGMAADSIPTAKTMITAVYDVGKNAVGEIKDGILDIFGPRPAGTQKDGIVGTGKDAKGVVETIPENTPDAMVDLDGILAIAGFSAVNNGKNKLFKEGIKEVETMLPTAVAKVMDYVGGVNKRADAVKEQFNKNMKPVIIGDSILSIINDGKQTITTSTLSEKQK